VSKRQNQSSNFSLFKRAMGDQVMKIE